MIKGKDPLDIIHELNVLRNGTVWHTIGTTGEPPFLNSWVNFNTTEIPAQYRSAPNGNIEVRFMIRGGSISSTAFALPTGYRPTKRYICDTISNDAQGRVDIHLNGSVVIQPPANNTWVSFSVIFSKN
jgi:hypothetical protein